MVLRPQTARNRGIKTKTQDVEKGSLCGKMGRRVTARVTLLVDMQSPKRLGQNNGRARRERTPVPVSSPTQPVRTTKLLTPTA